MVDLTPFPVLLTGLFLCHTLNNPKFLPTLTIARFFSFLKTKYSNFRARTYFREIITYLLYQSFIVISS